MRRSLGAIVLMLITVATGCGGGGGAEGQWTTSTSGPPVAPPELVAVGRVTDGMAAFERARFLDPDRASLVGPHRAYAFGAVVATTTITPDQAAANDFVVISGPDTPFGEEGLQAAEGYEFLVLRVEESQPTSYTNCTGPLDDQGAQVTATIRAGDQDAELDPSVGQLGSAGTTLLLSVPSGADVTLVLEDEGRAQSLDLRSGERGDDAVALYYPRRTATLGGPLTALVQVSGVPTASDIVGIDGMLNDGGLQPYYPELGWADGRRAWLCVTLSLLTAQFNTDTVLTVDAAASFALAVSGGATIAPEPGDLAVGSLVGWQGQPTSTLLFDVPVDFESGTLTFAPRGSATVGEEQEGTLASVPGAGAASAPIRLEGSGG